MKKKKLNTKKKQYGQQSKMGDTANDKSIIHFVRHYVQEIRV